MASSPQLHSFCLPPSAKAESAIQWFLAFPTPKGPRIQFQTMTYKTSARVFLGRHLFCIKKGRVPGESLSLCPPPSCLSVKPPFLPCDCLLLLLSFGRYIVDRISKAMVVFLVMSNVPRNRPQKGWRRWTETASALLTMLCHLLYSVITISSWPVSQWSMSSLERPVFLRTASSHDISRRDEGETVSYSPSTRDSLHKRLLSLGLRIWT